MQTSGRSLCVLDRAGTMGAQKPMSKQGGTFTEDLREVRKTMAVLHNTCNGKTEMATKVLCLWKELGVSSNPCLHLPPHS